MDLHQLMAQYIALKTYLRSRHLIKDSPGRAGSPQQKQKIISLGETVIVDLKKPDPHYVTIEHVRANEFTTSDGITISYDKVSLLVKKVSLSKRVLYAFTSIPDFIFGAIVGFAAVIHGAGR